MLAIARKLFEAEGPDVEMDEIAARAGVGVGTVYRHFPTKDALMRAVLAARIQHLADAAKVRLASPDPGSAFFEYLTLIAHEFLARGALHRSLVRASQSEPPEPERQALLTAFEAMLEQAQHAGAVRSDITAVEVLLLVRSALLLDESVSSELRLRLFTIVCEGLQRTSGAPRARRPSRGSAK